MRRRQDAPAPPYDVALTFRCTRPKLPAHAWPTKLDVDKLARGVLDGLVVGGLLADDRHVVALTASKRWCRDGEREGVDVKARTVAT